MREIVRSDWTRPEACSLLGVWGNPFLNHDARYLAVRNSSQSATVWRLDSGKPEKLLTTKNVSTICFHSSLEQVVFAYRDGSIGLFDLAQGGKIQRIAAGLPNREVIIALHPRDPTVAVGSYYSGVIQIRHLRTSALLHTLAMPDRCSHLAWHPSGLWLVASEANGPKIHVFDGINFQDQRQFGSINGGGHMFFNNAGDRLAVYDWSWAVQLFDFASGQVLFKVPITNPTAALQFSRDDRRLAGFADEGRLGYWEVADGREYRTIACRPSKQKNSYHWPTVSPDGRLLALATVDGVTI